MTLYVGAIPPQALESDVMALFEAVGEVLSVKIVRDHITQKPLGYGFVRLTSPALERAAIRELDNYLWDGKRIAVRHAPPGVIPKKTGKNAPKRRRGAYNMREEDPRDMADRMVSKERRMSDGRQVSYPMMSYIRVANSTFEEAENEETDG